MGDNTLERGILDTLWVNVGTFSSAAVNDKVDAFLIECIQVFQGIRMGDIFIQR